jgi:hypothetical protein
MRRLYLVFVVTALATAAGLAWESVRCAGNGTAGVASSGVGAVSSGTPPS